MLPENENFFGGESFTRDMDYQNVSRQGYEEPGFDSKRTLETIDRNLEDITNYEMSRGIIDNWQNFSNHPTKSKLDLKAFDFEKHCLLSLVIIRADNSWRGHLTNTLISWANPPLLPPTPHQNPLHPCKDFFGDISAIKRDTLTIAAGEDEDGVGMDCDEDGVGYSLGYGVGRDASVGGWCGQELGDGVGKSA